MKTGNSKIAVVIGWILSGLCSLFLLFDAVTKIALVPEVIKGSSELGWPVDTLRGLGAVLLACTILYVIPRTAILGAILLTGYLGGATATMVRASQEGHPYLFPVVFGIVIWAGQFLRDATLRSLIPIRRKDS
jgi:hypothetical protein